MAGPNSRTGHDVLIKISADGGTTHTHRCMINMARGLSASQTFTETAIPDCDTPTKPHAIKRTVQSHTLSMTGAGIYDAASAKFFADWALEGGVAKPAIAEVGQETGDLIYTGNIVLNQFDIKAGSDKDELTADMSFTFDGEYTITERT